MDIVERLRELANGGYDAEVIDRSKDMMEVAANEIERLRQQNAELLEESKKLKEAKEVNKYDHHYPDDGFGGRPMQYDYNRR